MREAGILMHISSLPSPYGIGTLGRDAYEFADFLAEAGQKYWQILPLSPTSYGDSPYQSPSGFAGNPYFIDLDMLYGDGLLNADEFKDLDWGNPGAVDFALLYEKRYAVLRGAQARFEARLPEDYESFCREEAYWLEDYALFMAQKERQCGAAWSSFPDSLKFRDPTALGHVVSECASEIRFWKMLQYLFFKQWRALKAYVNSRGISIIGDLPIYASADSADVWAYPRYFMLDERLESIAVAGCPPDSFTENGQLWGNPLFDWNAIRADGYAWWIKRLRHTSALYDITRIDHFRGFDSYYSIPAGSADARAGQWRTGPGIELFEAVKTQLSDVKIIAEDLGFLTDSVKSLLKDTCYPGMKVLQFAFDSREDSDYLPHNYERNCVVYTGTHDNDTILGWLDSIPAERAAYAAEYLRLSSDEGYNWGVMKAAWAGVGDLAIVQMQDLLGLGSEARMNTPGVIGGNWRWRLLPGTADRALAGKLRDVVKLYGR